MVACGAVLVGPPWRRLWYLARPHVVLSPHRCGGAPGAFSHRLAPSRAFCDHAVPLKCYGRSPAAPRATSFFVLVPSGTFCSFWHRCGGACGKCLTLWYRVVPSGAVAAMLVVPRGHRCGVACGGLGYLAVPLRRCGALWCRVGTACGTLWRSCLAVPSDPGVAMRVVPFWCRWGGDCGTLRCRCHGAHGNLLYLVSEVQLRCQCRTQLFTVAPSCTIAALLTEAYVALWCRCGGACGTLRCRCGALYLAAPLRRCSRCLVARRGAAVARPVPGIVSTAAAALVVPSGNL